MSADIAMLRYETQAKNQGLRFILGIDEAGRGPLAGPVVAAAVCLRQWDFRHRIDDSKKLSAKARQRAFDEICDKAYVGIGVIDAKAIDSINILNATHRAMEIAVKELLRRVQSTLSQTISSDAVMLFIDGNIFRTQLPFRAQTIMGGDARCLSIACASIIAKVYRDRLLNIYDTIFPQYDFARHKGYPTSAHRQAIAQHGISSIHRKSFQCASLI